ncbi:MAG: hypothetical protein QOJ88_29 [Pyrinomonadaceae bacterium]|nr:hypothetical protein [Pyrinomonadaceae bacterium]
MKKLFLNLLLVVIVFSTQSALGWNSTGHILVARIAWDNMSPAARKNAVNLLMQAPADACLRDLFPNDARPLDVRAREFFMRAATWPDIIRPHDADDHRPCTKYHNRDWHFVDHFWRGVSDDPNALPQDVPFPLASVNAVERLRVFRSLAVSNNPAPERAMELAWILHLVGDIHQPLHTSGRVTELPSEKHGDGGGNGFSLGEITLHSYWDGIVDRADPKKQNENFATYVERVANEFEQAAPQSTFTLFLPDKFDRWADESLMRAKTQAYPRALKRNQMPGATYRLSVFGVARQAVAEGGYRLAALMNLMYGT